MPRVGFSGVAYALFGFMWLARRRFPEMRTVVNRGTVGLFLYWQLFCFGLAYLGIPIGNVAHVSGLVFGALVGAFVAGWKPRLMLASSGLVVGMAVLLLVWCPWSPTWLGGRAYEAHAAERYEDALDLYGRVIRLDPDSAWAYHKRSHVRAQLGDEVGAAADHVRAREIDPEIEPHG